MGKLLIAYDFGRHYLNRGRKEYREFCERIEAEGGSIIRANRVWPFLKSPFDDLRRCPLYYCFDVRYSDRSGSWFVAVSDGSPGGDWVWCDAEGRSDLPVVRDDEARVDNSVIALEYVTGNIIAISVICFVIWIVFHVLTTR